MVGKLVYCRSFADCATDGGVGYDEDRLFSVIIGFDGQEKICIKPVESETNDDLLWYATYLFGVPDVFGKLSGVYGELVDDGWEVGATIGRDCHDVDTLLQAIVYGETFIGDCVERETLSESEVRQFMTGVRMKCALRHKELQEMLDEADVGGPPRKEGMPKETIKALERILREKMKFSKMPSVGVEL